MKRVLCSLQPDTGAGKGKSGKVSATPGVSLCSLLLYISPSHSLVRQSRPFPSQLGGGGRSATPNYLVIDLRARASQDYPFTYVSEHYMPDNLDGI